MPPSLEVLNSTLQQLSDSGIVTFKRKHWFMSLVFEKIPNSKGQGPFMERTLSVASNARGRMITRGDEILDHTRYRTLRKIHMYPFRWIVSPVIPKKDDLENSGPGAAVDLIQQYVMLPILAYYDDLNKAFLTGTTGGLSADPSQFRGILVLNGQYSAGVVSGTQNGLLDFAAFTAQSDTVQGLAKDSSIFYANQYRSIGAWPTSGMRTIEMAWRDCARYAQGSNKGPDVILMDPVTYSNYSEERRATVRTVITTTEDEKKKSLLQLDLGDGAAVCCEYDLDTTQFTGNAANGVTYLINSDGWEKSTYEELKIPPLRESLERQDGYVTRGAHHFATLCRNVAAQGVVDGGN